MDERIERFGALMRDATLETLWPTRCAICDQPGALLCASCYRRLPFIDWWNACPRCGSARGRMQCCLCNPVMLGGFGLEDPPFDGCVSAVELDARTGRIATLFKDGGEQRLAQVMAALMAPYIPPSWLESQPFVTFVPATTKAYRRRGFDHAELLAHTFAHTCALPGGAILMRPQSTDQRALSREQRLQNMEARFMASESRPMPETVLLIDDVYTTGATLFAASLECRRRGAQHVFCATFARTDGET